MSTIKINMENIYRIDSPVDPKDTKDRYYTPTTKKIQINKLPNDKLHVYDQKNDNPEIYALATIANDKYNVIGRVNINTKLLDSVAKRFFSDSNAGTVSCRSVIKALNLLVSLPTIMSHSVILKAMFEHIIYGATSLNEQYIIGYQRLNPILEHYLAALNEHGTILVSASLHNGWALPDPRTCIIQPHESFIGTHSFTLVGYNSTGLWVQNSWGKAWGKKGLALWLYEDWEKSILDAWVLNLDKNGQQQKKYSETIMLFWSCYFSFLERIQIQLSGKNIEPDLLDALGNLIFKAIERIENKSGLHSQSDLDGAMNSITMIINYMIIVSRENNQKYDVELFYKVLWKFCPLYPFC